MKNYEPKTLEEHIQYNSEEVPLACECCEQTVINEKTLFKILREFNIDLKQVKK